MARQLGQHTEPIFSYPTHRQSAELVQIHAIHTAWLAVGRAIFGGFFVFNGIHHFMELSTMAGFAASKGVPFPELAIAGTGALLILGGTSVILGAWPRVGASLIMLFLVGVTPVMHDFWHYADMSARMNEFGHFTKNVALFGGACFVMALPVPWPASLHGGR
jgi:uncharacterized membrane protein YphA (DoxX/SURF4 family)